MNMLPTFFNFTEIIIKVEIQFKIVLNFIFLKKENGRP